MIEFIFVVNLYEETQRLQGWIEDHGLPAVEEAKRLNHILNEYQNERDRLQLEAERTAKQVLTLNAQLIHTTSDAHLIREDHDKLRIAAEQSQNRFENIQQTLDRQAKELRKYKKLAKDLGLINEKYLKKNQELTEVKQQLEDELQNAIQIIRGYENEAMEFAQERRDERQTMQEEIQALRADNEAKEVQIQIADTAANDIGSIAQHFNQTLVIDKRTLQDDTSTTEADDIDATSPPSLNTAALQSTSSVFVYSICISVVIQMIYKYISK